MIAAATGSPPGAPAAMWKRPAPTDRHGVKPRRTPLGGGGRRRLRSSDAGTSSDVLGSSSASESGRVTLSTSAVGELSTECAR
jgi:hypothetical protein